MFACKRRVRQLLTGCYGCRLGNMSSFTFAVAAVVWAGLAVYIFMLGLLADEDSNHWDWPEGRDGPAPSTTAKIAAVACGLAAIPVAGALAIAHWLL